VCAKKYEFIVELKGGYNWKKTWKNTLCYFNINFLKRHLKRNGGSILFSKYFSCTCYHKNEAGYGQGRGAKENVGFKWVPMQTIHKPYSTLIFEFDLLIIDYTRKLY